jgi:hypothetical protein
VRVVFRAWNSLQLNQMRAGNEDVVSFRQGCVRPLESGFFFGEEAADGGSTDLKAARDFGFADSLPA